MGLIGCGKEGLAIVVSAAIGELAEAGGRLPPGLPLVPFSILARGSHSTVRLEKGDAFLLLAGDMNRVLK